MTTAKDRRWRRCRACGEKLPPTCLRLCEPCQLLGRGRELCSRDAATETVLYVAKAREAAGLHPLYSMSLSEIAALARCYHPPYNTYGKLRGYVTATGKLPPTDYERRPK